MIIKHIEDKMATSSTLTIENSLLTKLQIKESVFVLAFFYSDTISNSLCTCFL